jgi:hypothetical protein
MKKEQKRALHPELCQALCKTSGWPAHMTLIDWTRRPDVAGGPICYTMRRDDYGHLRRGYPVAPKYALTFVAFFLDQAKANKETDFVLTVSEFLADRGVTNPIAEPVLSLAEKFLTEEQPDVIRGEFGGLLRMLSQPSRLLPQFPVPVCESQLETVTRWVYIEAGRSECVDGYTFTEEAAIELAEAKFKKSMADYEATLRSWQKVDPWTIVYAMGKKEPVGVNIMAPVNESAFDEVRRGDLATFDIAAEDLRSPSRCLVFEALADRPLPRYKKPGNTSRSTLFTIFCQVASLSHTTGETATAPLRVLAPAGTHQNHQRLLEAGYTQTAPSMGGREIRIFERELHCSMMRPLDWMMFSWLRGLGQILRRDDKLNGDPLYDISGDSPLAPIV